MNSIDMIIPAYQLPMKVRYINTQYRGDFTPIFTL
jgi:hypothetical protein